MKFEPVVAVRPGSTLIVATAVFLSILTAGLFVFDSGLWVAIDYETFYSAARIPVDVIYLHTNAFVYPPTGLIFLQPLADAGFWQGFVFLGMASLCAFAFAVGRAVSWQVAALSLLSFPALEGLLWGQTPMLLVAGLFGALMLKGFWRGFVVGLLVSIKPQLFLAAPFVLLARKDYAGAAGVGAGGTASVTLSIALFGFQPWLDWLSAIPDFQATILEFIPQALVSPLGFAAGARWPLIPFALASGALAAWLIYRTRHSNDPTVIAATIGGASILCAPYALFHDLIVLIPAAVAVMLGRRHWVQAVAILLFCGLIPQAGIPILLWYIGYSTISQANHVKVAKTSRLASPGQLTTSSK